MAALREVIENQGLFCALYSDRGSHFFVTPKAGEKVDKQRVTQIGRALRELGVQMTPAYSPQARGRSERNFGPGRPTSSRVAVGENRWRGGGDRFLRGCYTGQFNSKFAVAAARVGAMTSISECSGFAARNAAARCRSVALERE